jgi:hypothetical protein
MVTAAPMTVGAGPPDDALFMEWRATCTTTLSWTLVLSPMVMELISPVAAAATTAAAAQGDNGNFVHPTKQQDEDSSLGPASAGEVSKLFTLIRIRYEQRYTLLGMLQ